MRLSVDIGRDGEKCVRRVTGGVYTRTRSAPVAAPATKMTEAANITFQRLTTYPQYLRWPERFVPNRLPAGPGIDAQHSEHTQRSKGESLCRKTRPSA